LGYSSIGYNKSTTALPATQIPFFIAFSFTSEK
jgi:hypothetical protein